MLGYDYKLLGGSFMSQQRCSHSTKDRSKGLISPKPLTGLRPFT